MDHRLFREHLALAAYDELDAEESAALEAHLVTCAECRRVQQELRAGLGARPRAALDTPPSPAWRAALRQRTGAAEVPDTAPRHLGRRALELALAFAAGVLLTWSLVPGAPAKAPGGGLEAVSFSRATPPPQASGRTRIVRLAEQWKRE